MGKERPTANKTFDNEKVLPCFCFVSKGAQEVYLEAE